MIKVLMCGNHPSNKGGMTSVISQIREYDWSDRNIRISFIPTYYPGNAIIKILYFAYAYIRVLLTILRDKPDIVHMHMSYKGSFTRKYLLHRLCKRHHIPDVIHLHGSEFEKWYEEVSKNKQRKIREFIKESDAFIVLGKKWEKCIKKIEKNSKLYIVNNCVHIPNVVVKWNKNKCEILFLGVLIPRKGLEDLVGAIQKLVEDGRIGNIHFTIAGSGPDEKKLKQLVQKKHLDKYVSFVGWVSGGIKKQYIQNCQLMVSPSYNEGLPVSILEAISYGMPVISSDVGDISSVIKNNKNGFLFQPGDIDQMADYIVEASNEDTFQRLSLNARKDAIAQYDIRLFYDNLEMIYSRLNKDTL